jgi:hypothetical protein
MKYFTKRKFCYLDIRLSRFFKNLSCFSSKFIFSLNFFYFFFIFFANVVFNSADSLLWSDQKNLHFFEIHFLIFEEAKKEKEKVKINFNRYLSFIHSLTLFFLPFPSIPQRSISIIPAHKKRSPAIPLWEMFYNIKAGDKIKNREKQGKVVNL